MLFKVYLLSNSLCKNALSSSHRNIVAAKWSAALLPSTEMAQLESWTGSLPRPLSKVWLYSCLGAINLNPLRLPGEVLRTPFLPVFYTLLSGIILRTVWESCADPAIIIFSLSGCSLLPRCLPALMGEQLSSVGQCYSSLTEKKKKAMDVFDMLPQIILHQ